MTRTMRFFIIIGLVLLVSGAAAATMTVSIDSASVKPDSNTVIPVKVSGASNLGAMDLVVTYDPSMLQFTGADIGELSTNGMIEANGATPGTVKIGFVDTKGVSGEGNIIKMTFRVTGAAGKTSQMNLQVPGAWNLDLVDIQTTTSGGTISVGGGKAPISVLTVLGALCVACAVLGMRGRQRG